MSDYSAWHGGPPSPEMPWPMFLALVERIPRMMARARLDLMDSVAWAIAAAMGEPHEARKARDEVLAAAYPGGGAPKRKGREYALIQSEPAGDNGKT